MTAPTPQRSQERRRLALAIALACALHAGLWLLPRSRPAPAAPRQVVQVELREVEPPRPKPVEVHEVAKAPKRATKPTPATRTPEQAPKAVAETTPAPTEIAPPPGIATESRPTAPAVPPRDPKTVRLFDPSALSGGISQWKEDIGGGQAQADHQPGEDLGDGPDTPEAERGRIEARVGRDLSNADATARVDGALVDPYFTQLAADLRRRLKISPGDVAGDPIAAGARSTNFLPQWAPIVPPGNGSPFASAQVADPIGGARPAGLPGADQMNVAEFCLRWNDGEFAPVRGWVVMLLVQTPEGRPLATAVLGSSGHHALEREARDVVLHAAEASRAPEKGFGLGGKRIKSVWRLEAKVLKKNPNCALSGRFGETLRDLEIEDPRAAWTRQEVVVTDVVLLAIEDGARAPAPQ